MSPIGKFTLAVLGLRFGGATGFFWGMFLGHILIDNTRIVHKIEATVSQFDDNLRLLLPYNISRYYNRIEGNFWGKIWCGTLGSLFYGFYGFLILFIGGHFLFDTPRSAHANKFRSRLDSFFQNNIGKILGGIIGFSLQSHLVLFTGVILGFFWDIKLKIRLPHWQLPHIFTHKNAYLIALACLAAKISKADGVVSVNEIKLFKKIFAIDEKNNAQISKVFNQAKETVTGYEKYARELRRFTAGNLELKEKIMESFYQIAWADGEISDFERGLLHKVAEIIGLPEGNLRAIEQRFEPKWNQTSNVSDFYNILGVGRGASDVEIKKRWRQLINQFHPDRVQANGASAAEVEASTLRMAEINAAYEAILKTKKAA